MFISINFIIFVHISICIKFVSAEYTYEVKYIDLPVDHFSFTTNETFKLRYLINDTYWNTEGPIFFYTGNEGDITGFAQNTGFMWEIADEFKALIIFAEHRYYGKSLPFGALSYSEPRYIGYLTSSQALADYVYLIDYLQNQNGLFKNGSKNPVIAFGGSYGGMLSAWIRIKYPASVLGAIAASAPILQFQTPCATFNRIVTSVFRISSLVDCSKIILETWPVIRKVTSTNEGRQWLTKQWKLCNPLKDNDVDTLIGWLQEVYTNMAMVNYPYPANFIQNLPGHPVQVFCKKLSNSSLQDRPLLEQLGKSLEVYTNYSKNVQCVNLNQSSTLDAYGWDFQACTEMIMPMCSTGGDMFETASWNYTKFSQECYNQWKVRVTKSDLAVLEYGGKYLKSASNIVFSNGLMDPWSGGGVLHNISDSVFAIIIPDGAHHLDLRARNHKDPPSVIQARHFHKLIIRRWLRTYYKDNFNLYYD